MQADESRILLPKMRLLVSIVFFFLASPVLAQTNCSEKAREVAPQLSTETRRDFEAKLAQARENVAKNPNDADSLIWLGRRTAYLGHYKESIRIYTDGIKKFPSDARFFRHRGHRLITLRCFDDAIKDLRTAVFWIAAPMKLSRMDCRTRVMFQPALCTQTFGITSGWRVT